MGDFVFVTAANQKFQKLADGLVNSIRKFYPDAPVFCHPYNDIIAGVGNEYQFGNDPGASYSFLLPYFDRYKRVILFNADFIMCAECPKLFGDFELAIAYNNIDLTNVPGKRYVQNSLVVATNPQIFKELTEMNRDYRQRTNHPYYDMNASNDLFWSGKYKTQVLSFPDESYGIEDMPLYGKAYLKGKDIYVRDGDKPEKKVCVFHFSGTGWKNPSTTEISYQMFENEDVRNRLKELIS